MKKIFIVVLKAIVSGILIWLTWNKIQQIDGFSISSFSHRFLEMTGIFLIYAISMHFVSMILSAYQWYLLLQKQSIEIPFLIAVRTYFVGLFFNQFLPGSVGGDFKKIYDIHKSFGKAKEGLTATLFDRIFGLFILNGFSIGIGLLYFTSNSEIGAFIIFPIGLFFGFVLFFSSLLSSRLGKFISEIFRKIKLEKFSEKLISLQKSFQLYRSTPLLLKLIFVSTLTQAMRVSVHIFVALSMGIHLDLSWFFYFIPLIAIAAALPITIGGFGVREFAAQNLFARIGVAPAETVIMQLTAYFVGTLISLMGGILFLLTGKAHIQK